MKIIDRYMLRQFIHVFVICFLSLTGLYLVLDAFSNLDNFLRYAEQKGSLLSVMGEFYFYRAIGFFERLSGVISMIAAMFTVTWIQRHNEMTALMAAGVSRVRVVRPVIIACVVLALLTAAGREVVIPRLRQQLSRDAHDLMGDQAQQLRPRYDNQTDILLRGHQTFANEKRVEAPSFQLPGEFSSWGTQLSAANAFYQPPRDSRPGGYLLKQVKEPAGIATKPSLVHAGRPVVITPRDARLAGRGRVFCRERRYLRAAHRWSEVAAVFFHGGDGNRPEESEPRLRARRARRHSRARGAADAGRDAVVSRPPAGTVARNAQHVFVHRHVRRPGERLCAHGALLPVPGNDVYDQPGAIGLAAAASLCASRRRDVRGAWR